MMRISLTADNIKVVKGNIVIILKKQLEFKSIFIEHRKNGQTIECDYDVAENSIFVKIEKNLSRGRYDLFIEAEDKIIRILLPSILKKNVADRYELLSENNENLNFAYFTLDGHLALQIVNKENNGHFNQFSGKMTVDDVVTNDTGKVTLKFRSSHVFNNLQVYLMEQDSNKLSPISFSLNNKDITLNIKELNFDYSKLLVIYYEFQGVIQNRWIDFGNWIQKSLNSVLINDINMDEESGDLTFDFFVESTKPIKGLELIVRNRATREELKSMKLKNDTQSFVQLEINARKFPLISTTNDDPLPEIYDGNIFDFLIRPIFKWIPCINYRMRMEFNDELKDEYWFNYDMKIKQLVMMYKTKVGNLAARFAYLPQNSFNRYKLLANKNPHNNNDKKILLVSEYINKAQDTGLYFFKYMIDNHKDEFDTYYIITEHSKDLDNLNGYMNNVIFYRSVKHIDIIWQASYLAHSHSSIYAFPFNSKRMNLLRLNMHKLFLQHGVMGVRDLGYLYQSDPLFTNKIVVSSNREKKVAEKNLHYTSNKIAVTGLSRFDRLIQQKSLSKASQLHNKILIMPSWRKGEDKLTDEDFKNTQFYKSWQGLLDNPEFYNLIRENNLSVDVYLHHNFQHYQHLFSSSFVHFVSEGNISVQDLLISHGLLITDFSSVGLDFSLLNRPVLYFNFDNLFDFQELEKIHFLPGEVLNNENQLIKSIEDYLKYSKLRFRYKVYRRKNIYKFSDKNANKRIYKALKSL